MNRLLFAAVLLTITGAFAQTYALTKYGSVADGKTLATAIRKAIDVCNQAGSTVDVPRSAFLTGALGLGTAAPTSPTPAASALRHSSVALGVRRGKMGPKPRLRAESIR